MSKPPFRILCILVFLFLGLLVVCFSSLVVSPSLIKFRLLPFVEADAYNATLKVRSTVLPIGRTTSVPPPSPHRSETHSDNDSAPNQSTLTTNFSTRRMLNGTSFFPVGYQPLPKMDHFVVEHADPDELVFFKHLVHEDLRHQPLVYYLNLETYADFRVSAYTPSSVFISDEEREALWQARHTPEWAAHAKGPPQGETDNGAMGQSRHPNSTVEPKKKEKRRKRDQMAHLMRNETFLVWTPPHALQQDSPVPRKDDAAAAALSVAPEILLPELIRGDISTPTTLAPMQMSQFLDRYFVQQMELSPVRNEVCDRFVELLHLPNRPPLVVHIFNWMVSRFVLRCLYFRTHILLTAKRKFVLLAVEGDAPASECFFLPEVLPHPNVNITYLVRHPLLAHWYGINGNIRHPKFTPTPIGTLVHHISATSLRVTEANDIAFTEMENTYTALQLQGLDLNQLFPHVKHQLRFGRSGSTWLEKALEMFAGGTTDPPVEWIPLEQLPERVTTVYVVEVPAEKRKREGRPSLFHEVLIIHNEPGNRAAAAAQHVALLPFTAALYHKLQQHPYGEPGVRRKEVLTAFTVWSWRASLLEHLKNETMRTASGVEPLAYVLTDRSQHNFFRVINNFTFVVSPIGMGYDCFRTWEALSFGAIPIIVDPEAVVRKLGCVGSENSLDYGGEVHPSALVAVFEGLPVIRIFNETEIQEDNLEKWRAEIYEKAKRGEYQLEKLFSQYWIDKIYGHTNGD